MLAAFPRHATLTSLNLHHNVQENLEAFLDALSSCSKACMKLRSVTKLTIEVRTCLLFFWSLVCVSEGFELMYSVSVLFHAYLSAA